MRKSAMISLCGRFRYELRRVWDEALPPFAAGMLNPSTADAEMDDPTIIRILGRARASGCGSLIVWNLGAGRATNPKDWMRMGDPIGPENDTHIKSALSECREKGGIAFVGWGAHGTFMSRDQNALRIAAEVGVQLQCLGTTRDGQPRHPLYIGAWQPLMPFAADVDKIENPESFESLTSS